MCPEQEDRIGDLELAAVVGVRGVEAGGLATTDEEVVERRDGVAQVDVAVLDSPTSGPMSNST
jgi:hypothetical protein